VNQSGGEESRGLGHGRIIRHWSGVGHGMACDGGAWVGSAAGVRMGGTIKYRGEVG
jgi:hypothetical protein